MIKDSGNRTKFDSGAVRDIQEGKGRCDLLPLEIIDLWCDDGLQCTLYWVGEYLKKNDTTDYFQIILDHFAAEHQAKRIASGEDNEMITLDQYKWNLVLEVAKHFEEGAKKYGDRNWEKGIPCDRYIDSAVRHYCKWRAGWTDEPHDRAFIWNIVCCEWTRQQYGWSLEKLNESKPDSSRYESILTKGRGDFRTQCLNRYIPYTTVDDHLMSGSLEKTASDWQNQTRFTRCACRYLYDKYGHAAGRVWILDAEKSLNISVAVGCGWKKDDDVTPKMLESYLYGQGWKPGVDFVIEAFDDDSESKKFVQIGERLANSVRASMDSMKRLATAISESPLTFHVKKEDILNMDILAQIKEKEAKDQETAELKEACAIIEHDIACFNSPAEVCWGKTCKECEHYIAPDVMLRAVNQLLDHAKKSLKEGSK